MALCGFNVFSIFSRFRDVELQKLVKKVFHVLGMKISFFVQFELVAFLVPLFALPNRSSPQFEYFWVFFAQIRCFQVVIC